MKPFTALPLAVALSAASTFTQAQAANENWVKHAATAQADQVIEWRRHLHQHPELGNQEHNTSAFVATTLRKMGLAVHMEFGGTGVVAVLKGDLPGPVVGLRADMDALPIKEATGLPFASKAQADYFGKTVDVMHACGHDAHTAMLMGAARLLAKNRDKVPGTVVFVFQPAEEGPSNIDIFAKDAAKWGAKRMVAEGLLEKFGIQAMFAMHVASDSYSGEISYKPGITFNSSDSFRIRLLGKQAHGSTPWEGADPIVASANVLNAMQTLVNRRAQLTVGMGVVSVGSIHGGTANNIIPEEVIMNGTIRSDSASIRETLTSQLAELVSKTAQAQQVQAEVQVVEMMPLTVNNAELTYALAPAMAKASDGHAEEIANQRSGSEDFAYYAQKVPGLYVFLGQTPKGRDLKTAAGNHTPTVFLDEETLTTGVRAHAEFVLGYANYAKQRKQ
jgi:amidohydrolase